MKSMDGVARENITDALSQILNILDSIDERDVRELPEQEKHEFTLGWLGLQNTYGRLTAMDTAAIDEEV